MLWIVGYLALVAGVAWYLRRMARRSTTVRLRVPVGIQVKVGG